MTTGQTKIQVVDVTGGHAVPLTLLNCYSVLSIPAYKRAVTFLAENLASFGRSVRKDGAKLDVAHPLDKLLNRRPNGYQNALIFWRTLFFHAAHTGNGYARIDREGITARPAALHNLLPEDVTPFRWEPEEGASPLQFYYHRTTKSAIVGADVLHLQCLSHDGMSAMDPVALHDRAFQRAATIEKFQVQYLKNGTVVRGAVEIPGAMTPEQRQEIRAVLRTYRGGENDDDVMILSDGAKLSNAGVSAQQSQLVEQGAASTKAIAQITGVPPAFLYELSEEKYRNTVEQDGQNVVRYTFRPWIEMVEAELTSKLLTDAEQDGGLTIHINPNALLRGDTKTQVDTVVAAVNGGVRTRNEGRELLGLPPDSDPDSDKLKTLGDATPKPLAPAV